MSDTEESAQNVGGLNTDELIDEVLKEATPKPKRKLVCHCNLCPYTASHSSQIAKHKREIHGGVAQSGQLALVVPPQVEDSLGMGAANLADMLSQLVHDRQGLKAENLRLSTENQILRRHNYALGAAVKQFTKFHGRMQQIIDALNDGGTDGEE